MWSLQRSAHPVAISAKCALRHFTHCAAGEWGASPPLRHPGGPASVLPSVITWGWRCGACQRRNLLQSSGKDHTDLKNKPFAIAHDQHEKKKKKSKSKQILQRSPPVHKCNYSKGHRVSVTQKQVATTDCNEGQSEMRQKGTLPWLPRLCSSENAHTAAFEKPTFLLYFIFVFLSSTINIIKCYLS